MSYSLNYKTCMPYSKWHEDIYNLKVHIEERCQEVAFKYDAKNKLYERELSKEYAKGEDFGKAFEQQNISLYIRLNLNRELISLESEVKSTLEKILKDIASEFSLIKQEKCKGGFLNCYIRLIEEGKQIEMSKFNMQKEMINDMRKKRNDSEHHTDSLLRKIDAEYIMHITSSVYDYVDALIRELYNKK